MPPQIQEVSAPEVAQGLPLDRSSLLYPRATHHVRAHKLRGYNLSAYKLPVYKRKRISGLVVASVMLVFIWILYTDQPATMSPAIVPPPQSPNAATQQTPPLGASQTPVTATAAASFPAQVEDQTVRYVASAGQRRPSDLGGRVKHFGNDVTVRYFTPRTPVIKTTGGSEVHEVSDDVTVRYIKPTNLGPQSEPTARGSPRAAVR